MVLKLNQPLTPDHPFYGGRIIFGFKRPDLAIRPPEEPAERRQSDQTKGSEPRLSGNGNPAGPQDSDSNPEEQQ
jgi:hypothetical protein